jgi:hypothetical protein
MPTLDDRFPATEVQRVEPDANESRLHQRLAEAMERYLFELESGRPPNHSQLIADYPDIAEPLKACLSGLDVVHQVTPRLHEALRPNEDQVAMLEPSDDGLGRLGDFRLIRQIGRGGMGVVYEAQQISLRRRVALKVLPFAAVLDNRKLIRFQNEAQAAATLEHPHIVNVFYVGCERGVHFYAMRHVDGRSLAEVIGECSKEQGARGEEQGARGMEQGAGSKGQGTGRMEQGAGDKELFARYARLFISDSPLLAPCSSLLSPRPMLPPSPSPRSPPSI